MGISRNYNISKTILVNMIRNFSKKNIFLYFYYKIRSFYYFFVKSIINFSEISSEKETLTKIIIVRTDNIGDFIIFSSGLKYLKEIYPNSKFVLIANKNIGNLIEKFKEIDEFIPLNVKKFQVNPFYYFNIFKKLNRERFQIAIYPAYSRVFSGDELIRMADAKEKIGFMGDNCNLSFTQKRRDNKFYTKLIMSTDELLPEVERNKIFIEALGCKIENKQLIPSVDISGKELLGIEKVLKENGWRGGKYVVVNPGAGLNYKIWPLSRFSEVIDFLISKNFEVVVTGSKNEDHLFNLIQNNTKNKLINLTGKTSLIMMLAILKKAEFYFGSDTGSVHMAVAVSTPTICLMGGGHFGRFFPYGDLNKNRIVYDVNMKCKNDNWECARINGYNNPTPCIEAIKVGDVIKSINEILINLKL